MHLMQLQIVACLNFNLNKLILLINVTKKSHSHPKKVPHLSKFCLSSYHTQIKHFFIYCILKHLARTTEPTYWKSGSAVSRLSSAEYLSGFLYQYLPNLSLTSGLYFWHSESLVGYTPKAISEHSFAETSQLPLLPHYSTQLESNTLVMLIGTLFSNKICFISRRKHQKSHSNTNHVGVWSKLTTINTCFLFYQLYQVKSFFSLKWTFHIFSVLQHFLNGSDWKFYPFSRLK